MRGRVYIERENTDGDRRIVEYVDPEALLNGVDRMGYIRERAALALKEAATYRVRAIEEDDDICIYTRRV